MIFTILTCFILFSISHSIKDNYITALIKIGKKDIDSKDETDIIHSYERFYENRNNHKYSYHPYVDKILNAKQIIDSEITINSKNIGFSYKYKFLKEGIYTIIYKFNTPLNSTSYLFYYCTSIISIDLSHFDSTYITDTRAMFYMCKSLQFINFSNFNTINVINMNIMFYGCEKLNSLNLSSFITSNLKYANDLFAYCKSLKSLDLSNFNTTNVITMNDMFTRCTNLISLNISNFNTKNVQQMSSLFFDCKSLINL